MQVRAIRTRVFREGEDIAAFITSNIPTLREGSIVAVASKLVALAEGRVAPKRDKEKLIKAESSWHKRVLKEWWLTVRQGIVIVNAGIDESNADGKLVLLPEDAFASAKRLREALLTHYHIEDLGVVITDSRVSPLRRGVTGVALGYAGFRGVRDYRGRKDIFGRKMEVTATNVADCLASAAVLEMGEGSERQPLAIMTDAPVVFAERIAPEELAIPMQDDMYRGLFTTDARRVKRRSSR